jgi:hypothetical protein
MAASAGIAYSTPVPISSLPGVTGTSPAQVTGSVTLNSGTDYLLDTEVYVNGGTLTIQPGVKIAADADGALIVCRGSQILAEGTAAQPIVFTSLQEYNHLKNPGSNPAPQIGDNGKWGGIILLGSAPINFHVAGNPFTGSTTGNTNRGENQIEGVSAGADADGDGLGDLLEYGQNNVLSGGLLVAGTPNADDNSGVFKYVSIRFGGKVLGLDNEINGLTLGGVGRGTTIEYVEVVNNTDDGFEWFGGTVNCKHLVSAFNEDEDFDMDEGYYGKVQFAFALRNDDVDGAGNVENGSELDGGNGSILTGTPLTTAQVWNATYLGAGRVGAVASKGNVFRMKDNFAGQFHNCVFDDFGGNLIRIDDTNTAARVGNELLIQNSHWGRYNGTVGQGQVAAANTLATGTGNTDPLAKTDPLLRGVSRQPDGGLDPRPMANSPLYGSSLSTPPAGITTVNYRGAFGTTNWASGWTYLAAANFFGDLPGGSSGDVTAPVIALIGANPINILVGGAFTDPGANVTDNVDAPRMIVGTGTVNTNQPATYVITYNAVDAAGNAAVTVTRNVIVSAPTPVIPTSVSFVSSTGSPLNIGNFFQTGVYSTASVAVVGKLPRGMTFNSTTKLITGYPTAAGAATFNVTVPGQAPVTLVMNFSVEAVPASLQGTHILHTDAGDSITLTVTNKAAATLAILSPTATKATSVRGLAKYDATETDPNKQWTIGIAAQGVSIAFPSVRTLKEGDQSYLGNYGTLAGKPLWGFKSSNSTGEIVLAKAGSQIKIAGILGTNGSVAWTITPAAGKAIKATGRVSADGIASVRAMVPGSGLLAGMLRVDEAVDGAGQPTGQLNVSLLQGFDGWTPVSYIAR